MSSYVYIYVDPTREGNFKYEGLNCTLLYEPFYIGKGTKQRLYEHISESKRRCVTEKNKRIKALIDLGFDMKSYIIKVVDNLSYLEAFEQEALLISAVGRQLDSSGPLLNIANGGTGGCPGQLWKMFPDFVDKVCTTYLRHSESTLQEVADILNISIATLWTTLKENNISVRNSRLAKTEHMHSIAEELCKEYLEGASSVTLSAKYGIDHKSVTKVLDLNNILRRPAGRYSKANLEKQVQAGMERRS